MREAGPSITALKCLNARVIHVKTDLSRVLDQETVVECIEVMHKIKEDRHFNTPE